jgi:hypothetical protein
VLFITSIASSSWISVVRILAVLRLAKSVVELTPGRSTVVDDTTSMDASVALNVGTADADSTGVVEVDGSERCRVYFNVVEETDVESSTISLSSTT